MRERFEHHCDACVFLGATEKHDFYFCKSCESCTVIARYGTRGNYSSSPVFCIERYWDRGGQTGIQALEEDGKPGRCLTDAEVEKIPTVIGYRMAQAKGLI